MKRLVLLPLVMLLLMVFVVSCAITDSQSQASPSSKPDNTSYSHTPTSTFLVINKTPTFITTTNTPEFQMIGLVAFSSIGNEQSIGVISLPDGKSINMVSSSKDIFLSPSWSPSGKYIAYIKETREHYSDIYKINLETSEIQQLTFDGKQKSGISWSPDENQLAYSVKHDETMNIYLLNLRNNTLQNLTTSNFDDISPSWDPSGERIAFLRFDANNYSEGAHIEIIQADGKNLQEIKDVLAWTSGIDWSPDGKTIAFRSNDDCGDIYSINIDGTNLKQLTHMPGGEKDPVWAMDGKYLLFASSEFQCDHSAGGEPLVSDWKINLLEVESSVSIPILSEKNISFFNPDWILVAE